jgi:hypothetical protein
MLSSNRRNRLGTWLLLPLSIIVYNQSSVAFYPGMCIYAQIGAQSSWLISDALLFLIENSNMEYLLLLLLLLLLIWNSLGCALHLATLDFALSHEESFPSDYLMR